MAEVALQAAVSGTKVAQFRIDTIAGNVANLSTTAYKRMEVQSSDLFYMNLKKAGILESSTASKRPVGVQVGMGAKIIGTYRNLSQGPLTQTSHPFDVALLGPGYFAVALPNGQIGYTRAGTFKRDPDTGDIVTMDGKPFTDNIAIPANILTQDINIAQDGTITAQDPNNSAALVTIGKLSIFTFPNEDGLQAVGDNTFIKTVGSGDAVTVTDTSGKIQQGWLEQSNVTAVEELTELITAQRAYELNSRVIRVVDEVSQDTNAIK